MFNDWQKIWWTNFWDGVVNTDCIKFLILGSKIDFLGPFYHFLNFCFGSYSAQVKDFCVNSVIFRFYRFWALICAAIWVDSLKNSQTRSKTITQHPKKTVKKVEQKIFIFDFSRKKISFFQKTPIPSDSSKFCLYHG